jgi:hypothetical protein
MEPDVNVSFLIICAGFLGFFVLLFGTLALMRWFRYKETLAMIERGLVPDDVVKKERNGKGSLIWGIAIVAFGLALIGSVCLLAAPRAGRDLDDSTLFVAPSMLPGLVVLFMGIALIIIYLVTRPRPAAEPLEKTLPPVEPGETPFDEAHGKPDLPALELEADEESLADDCPQE